MKRAWAYYQYAYQLNALYNGQKELAERLKNSGEERYRQGDIDLAERNMITAMAADLYTRWMEASEELTLAGRRFAWTCYSDQPLLPADTTLTVMQMPTGGLSLSSRHLTYFDTQVQEKKDLLKIERSRTKQARIALQTASWEAKDNRRQLSNKVNELQSQLTRQRERLTYYQQAAVKEADALQNSALKKFQANETGISEFIQSLNAAREIRRSYIETVYAYNVTLVELELYTEQTN